MEASNRREFIRVPLQVRVEVKGGGLSISSTATENLSLKGLKLHCSEQLPEGTACLIRLFLGEGAIRIDAEGTVVHCYSDGLAFQFTRIIGLESFEHLRNLLLYNASDPNEVEHEFQDSVGIHRHGEAGSKS
jgi:PilZ domain